MTNEELVEQNLIFRCIAGSTALGLNTENSDIDELGVYIEPPEKMLGFEKMEHLVHTDPDYTFYGLKKFCGLALKGNPTIFSLLFTPANLISINHPIARELFENKEWFYSKQVGKAFLGYMNEQTERLEGKRGQMNVKRSALIEKYGWDVKYGSQIIRLGIQGNRFLEFNNFDIPMRESDRKLIMQVLQGDIRKETVIAGAYDLANGIKTKLEKSNLPETANLKEVENFVIRSYRKYWEL